MSIALALIPLALPAIPVLVGLRLVLGKEGFDRLISSMQVKIPTVLKGKEELASAVIAAGYDFKHWAGGFKTHLRGSSFFTWEFDGKRWIAVLPKGIAQGVIAEFVRSVETKAGRPIFDSSADIPEDSIVARSEPIPTNFRDKTLLVKTLNDAGANLRTVNGEIICEVGNSKLKFVQIGDGPYQVEIDSAANRQQLLQLLMMLDEDYRRCVQAETYQRVIDTVADRNLAIESEEVLEDNSILLTLTIQE